MMYISHRRTKRSPLFIYLALLAYVALLLALARLGFLIWTLEKLSSAPIEDILKGYYIGFRFDARWAAIITFPLGLALTIRPLGRKLRPAKNLIYLFYCLVFFILWTVYAFDTGFFAYLGERLNATIIELAQDTAEGLQMLSESYPLPLLVGSVVALALASALPIWLICGIEIKETRGKTATAATWLCGFLIFAIAAYGQLSTNYFPLRWSNAYFSTNAYVTALGLNPVQNLYDTYRSTKDEGFDLAASKAVYPFMAEYLQVDNPDLETLDYARFSKGTDGPKPNVVIIIMESLTFPKTSFAPGNDDPTPFLKTLAGQSVYFPNFFANARTTARGVFSTITGIPDVTQSSTGSRNPRVIDQRVIGNEFAGYSKYYMLGGNTAWANIRGIIANNISGIKILEEGYWKASNVDVWGVSDYDLLMESHELFASLDKKQPFMAVIQTASFHKPFTIPANLTGFVRRHMSEETAANYGFVSEDEYNSMRYMDYCVEAFFEKAKSSAYYDNTIFMLFGDHGINDPSANTTESYNASLLRGWHVPLIIHAPGRLAPQVRLDEASQVDVFPTAAGLASIDYTNWTLGRDLLSPTQNQHRGAFISGKNDSPIRFVQDGFCYFDNRAGKRSLYLLADNDAKDYKEIEPEIYEQMRQTVEAIQTTCRYWLYNNRKNQEIHQ